MKKIVLILALFIFTSFVIGQNIKVPEKVKSEFAKAFPKATDVKWDKESANEYEVSFKNGNIECTSAYDAKGKFIESEIGMQTSELSKTALDFIKKNYAGHQLTKAFKITDAKGTVSFEAEITKGKIMKELLFDKSGKPVVKKEKNDKEDKEKK